MLVPHRKLSLNILSVVFDMHADWYVEFLLKVQLLVGIPLNRRLSQPPPCAPARHRKSCKHCMEEILVMPTQVIKVT